MENVCEHGDHEAPEGKRFCSKECEACEHAISEDGCSNLCGRRDPMDTPRCIMCNTEMPVACKDCTEYAFEAVRAPKNTLGELKDKLEELHKLQWWANHGNIPTRSAMEMPLKNAKTDFAEWVLEHRDEIKKL